jgi:hypothetical protein
MEVGPEVARGRLGPGHLGFGAGSRERRRRAEGFAGGCARRPRPRAGNLRETAPHPPRRPHHQPNPK